MIHTERWTKVMNGVLSRSLFLGMPKHSELCSSIVTMIIDEYTYYEMIRDIAPVSELTKQYVKYWASIKTYNEELEKYLSRFAIREHGEKIIERHINKLRTTDLLGIGKSFDELVY